MAREEELAKGLAALHENMRHITNHIAYVQSLVPVFDFGDMIESDERADDTFIESMTAQPPQPTRQPQQIPLFEVATPITVVFENVYINGEEVDMDEGESHGRS